MLRISAWVRIFYIPGYKPNFGYEATSAKNLPDMSFRRVSYEYRQKREASDPPGQARQPKGPQQCPFSSDFSAERSTALVEVQQMRWAALDESGSGKAC